ncbi:hypothetical protein G6F23_013964 [Rhizopus arrhizus]|nr:hypothetical protein G6F23_013964 [Rhizopus arrhizus]
MGSMHHQHPDQPQRPLHLRVGGQGLRAVAGADDCGVRHRETQVRGQPADGLRQPHEGVGGQQGGGPDEAVAGGGQHRQQGRQRGAQGGQPQQVADGAEEPAQRACARQQVQEGLRHQGAVGSARQLAGGPEPEAAQSGHGRRPDEEAGQPQQEAR